MFTFNFECYRKCMSQSPYPFFVVLSLFHAHTSGTRSWMPPKLADLLLPDEKLIRFDVLQHSFNQILIVGNLF